MAVGPQKAWSVTAASNASADSNVNWAEGQAPPTLNNSARAMMASLKGFVNQLCGGATYGGSANAYTITSDSVAAISTAYAAGMAFALKANHTCSGASTLNVDGVGAVAITKNGVTAVASGDIVSGNLYFLIYDTTTPSFQIVGSVGAGSQPLDATLTAFGAVTVGADKLVYATGTDAFTTTDFTAAARSILDDASVGAICTTLGAAQLSEANIFTNATNTFYKSGAAAKTRWGETSGTNYHGVRNVSNVLTFDYNTTDYLTISATGAFAFTSTVQARVPLSGETTGTLTSASANKKVACSGGITLDDGVFTTDDFILFDPGTSARTFTRAAGCTMYVNGTDSASATLAANQMGAAHWRSASVVVLSGAFS